jgi:2-dehydropantoate 2-reductase
VKEITPSRYQFIGPGSAEWAAFTPNPPESSEILGALSQLGTQLKPIPSVREAEWRKLAWNAPMNAPLALEGRLNGELPKSPELLERFDRILNECVQVALAEGIDLNPDGHLRNRLLAAIEITASNLNSMAADVLRGRPTEIDWINGAIAKKALKHGLKAPENERISAEIRKLSTH